MKLKENIRKKVRKARISYPLKIYGDNLSSIVISEKIESYFPQLW